MKINKKVVVIAVLLAIITTIGVYYYIQSIEEEVSDIQYKEVWVAKGNIPAKVKIDKDMLKKADIQEDYVLKNAIFDSKDIVGKYTIERILEGEQILTDRLVEIDKSQFSYQIPIKTRAVTIEVNQVTGVADLIQPGDYVDVVVYIEEKIIEESEMAKTFYPDIAKLAFQNLLVLSVDQYYGQEDKKLEAGETRKVTLAVKAVDSEKMVLGDEIGTVHLALRHPEEKTIYETPGAIREDVVPDRGKRLINN